MRTIIQSVTEEFVILSTREYVMEINEASKIIPKGHKVITVDGKKYRLVSNSWANYVCSYRVLRKPIEQIIYRKLLPTPQTEISRSKFHEDKISFSSDCIWFYIIAEIVIVSCILIIAYILVTRIHFLLWLPSFATLQFLLFFIAIFYSPALIDADWFHQRIIIEDIALYCPFINRDIGFFLVLLSVSIYVLYKIVQILAGKNIIMRKIYVLIGLVIILLILICGLILEYRTSFWSQVLFLQLERIKTSMSQID